MPRGRFINKTISLDEKVDSLSCDTARLLFTWLIIHLDCEGRMHGDAVTVKSIIFPRRNIRATKVEKYLFEMEENELIVRYSCNGNTYLAAPNFNKHQVGLQKSKEAQSQIPPPTPELLQSYSIKSPPQVEVEVKDKVKVKVVVGDRGNDNLLNELDKLTSWGKSQEDGLWLLEFKKEFNEFNDSHIKACRDYHSTKTKHTKALWKTRLRNWMVIEKRKVSNNGAKGKMATPDELKTGWG